MKQLLATIVFAIAIFAGFTARAGDNNPVIIVKKSNGIVKCQIYSSFDSTDSRLSAREFESHKECEESAAFYYFKSGKKKVVDKTPPLLRNLGKDVYSVEKTPVTDTRLLAYVTYFEKKTGKTIDRNKIFFAKLNTKVAVGFCYYDKDLVLIDKEYWNGSHSEYSKEGTVHHELGHCYFERRHNGDETMKFDNYSEKCPVSLMHPQAFDYKEAYYCFNLHRDYYFNELKTPPKKFAVAIKVLSWTKKNGWKKEKVFTDVADKFEFKIKGQVCTFDKYKVTKTKYGYKAQFFKLRCTKDYVMWHAIGHQAFLAESEDAFKRGFAQGSHYSSDLRIWDSLTKEELSITLEISLK